jgi:hypothetical protein
VHSWPSLVVAEIHNDLSFLKHSVQVILLLLRPTEKHPRRERLCRKMLSNRNLQSGSPREEEGVPASISADFTRKVPLRIKLVPSTGRVDVLIPHVPPPIDHFRVIRIVLGAFEGVDVGEGLRRGSLRFGRLERFGGGGVGVRGRELRLRGCFGGVVEDALAVRADTLVDEEVIKVIMLAEAVSNMQRFRTERGG